MEPKENQCDVLTWNKRVPNTELEKFMKIIANKYNLRFSSYWCLHKWTVENYELFWGEIWTHFKVVFSKPYDKVFLKTGPGFLDNKWFPGAEFNYAENLLRIRDNREALICLDGAGHLDKVTYAEMFEEVKLYAAAFKKRGLKKGERVACYMSNRKEAVFAMLAASSIGAIWGGPQPYFGARAASNIIQKLEAKFLITVDIIYEESSGEEYNLIDNLPIILESSPNLECIIIVPTRDETLLKDMSHLPNSCFLDDFLSSGKLCDGRVPDIKFEQLPADHPVFISFSSGTTGLPKGPVHSGASLIGIMADCGLHYNLKSGDTIHSVYPMGWIMWNIFVSSLSLGVRLYLHNGNIFNKKGSKNMWDILSEYKISFTCLVTSMVDKMEKMNLQPTHSDANFKHLQFILVGGSPVKLQNHKYLKSIVKEDVFISNVYAATEIFGGFSGCDLNSPCYANQVQLPALGRDLQVFNRNGQSVIGEAGEAVVVKPSPTFLVNLWKDENNELLNRTYLSQYPGVWQQHDKAFINPETKGILVLGRSDETIIQNGERFGSSDIYFAIHDIEEIEDYICVGQNKSNGDSRAVLFLKLKKGHSLTCDVQKSVAKKIESELWLDCVPEVILEVKDIPYNASNKRLESLIQEIVATNRIPHEVIIKNPTCLKQYLNIPEIINYNSHCEKI